MVVFIFQLKEILFDMLSLIILIDLSFIYVKNDILSLL